MMQPTPAQLQRDFFDIFRVLKNRQVSAKAAVYPGLTQYGPYFNIGHDAIFLEAGYSPETEDYIEFCLDLLNKRLGDQEFARLESDIDGLKAVCYAANGLPRGLIVMAEYLLDFGEKAIPKARYFEAIGDWVRTVDKFHTSLKTRLPRYGSFVEAGTDFVNMALNSLKDFNKDKSPEQKAVYIALSNPIPGELKKLVDILQYAGLVTESKDISKGEKGVFTRYLVHLGKIIQDNALAEGQTKTLSYVAECLNRIKTKQFKRFQSEKILDGEFRKKCTFVLPPCPNCGRGRISEDARFCAYCGTELKDASLFNEIVEQDISVLPLTEHRVSMIKTGCAIRTVKDVLMDENGVELKKVKWLKAAWAQKIRNLAEEFVGG